MPVTARLSKDFYDRLGDDIANELVEWLNQMDAASRDDLKALNELNYARFEAKLERRTVELRAHAGALAQGLERKIDTLGQRLDAKIDAQSQALDAKIDRVGLEVRNDVQARMTEQVRWMVLTWGVLLAAVIGLYTR
jgi:hypothetical protein